jgi:hypothetical protein
MFQLSDLAKILRKNKIKLVIHEVLNFVIFLLTETQQIPCRVGSLVLPGDVGMNL